MADSESPLGELGPVERGRGGEERETEREVNEQRLDKTRKEKGRMLERQRKKDRDREAETRLEAGVPWFGETHWGNRHLFWGEKRTGRRNRRMRDSQLRRD